MSPVLKTTRPDRDESLTFVASLLLLSTASDIRSEDSFAGLGYLIAFWQEVGTFLKAFWGRPTRRTPGDRRKTNWRDYVSQLDWECLRTTQEELEALSERTMSGFCFERDQASSNNVSHNSHTLNCISRLITPNGASHL